MGADKIEKVALDFRERLILHPQGQLRLTPGQEAEVKPQEGIRDIVATGAG